MPPLPSKRSNLLMDSPESSSSPTSSVTINDLPCEMLLEVFSYLDQEQLLNTIPQVCTRWETLHSDPTLYRRFIFTEQGPSTEDALKLLSMAKWLKTLKLDRRNDVNAILKCVKTSNLGLETLTIQNCKGSPFRYAVSSVTLSQVLDNCNLLQHLSLDIKGCTDVCMSSLATCQHLKTLDLRNAGDITDIGIMAISDMPQLVKLTVWDNQQISAQGWLAFLQRPTTRRLQELQLSWCGNVNQEAVNMILNNPSNLRLLRIVKDRVLFQRSFNPGNQ